MKRRKHSLETRLKMSLAQTGKNNSNWKGGKPKCVVCGKKQTVHHSPRCRACSCKDPLVIAKFKKMFKGEKNPRWKGGITPLTRVIRELPETYEWRDRVFAKSNYACVDCGATGYLEAHHIIPFSKLFRDFVNIYNQFSVIDDKDTLVRLALTYKPFYDVSNGKALCEKCHENYRRESRVDTRKTDMRFSIEVETTSQEASDKV